MTIRELMNKVGVREGEVVIFCNFEGTNMHAEISDYWFTEPCWYDLSTKANNSYFNHGRLCCEVEGIDYMSCLQQENIEWLDEPNQNLLLRWYMVGEEVA